MSAIQKALSFVIAAALGMTAFAPSASAAKSTTKTPTSAPLALTYEYTSLNPNDPPWCLSEDDFHLRTWTGALNGTFTASDYLCDPNVDYYRGMWWDPAGLGVYVSVDVVGTVQNLGITSPTGVTHSGVLVSSSTSKGVTTDHYEACFMPPASVSTGSIGAPIPGGTWHTSLAGTTSSVTYHFNIEMGYVNWQQQHCPTSEQNLVP